MKKLMISAVLASALLGAAQASAQDMRLSATTGVDYSVGDFGTPANTHITVAPFSLRASGDRLRLSASIPYIRINGSQGIVGGGEGGPIIVDPDNPDASTTRSGLGDLSLGATYAVLSQDNVGFDLDVNGRVKLPVGDSDNGLSTGKTDWGFGAEISRDFDGVAPFVSLGYRMPGDPEGVDLQNSMTASVGTSIMMGRSILIASYDYSGKTSVNALESHSLFGGIAQPLGKRFMVTGYGSAGLSDGAPDYGMGLLLTVNFGK